MSNLTLPHFDTSSESELPLPLIVAQKWNFTLTYIDLEGIRWYALQDWVRGITGEEDVRKIISKMKNQTSTSSRHLPYLADDGKTYEREYTDDKGLYLTAQYLRSTKKRAILDEIKKYLAASGAFVDLIRREPETVVTSGAIDPDQAIDAAIKAYRAQGKDDRWIQARIEGKIKRNRFTAALSAAVADVLTPRHYAMATDDIYKGLWGRTAAYLKGELGLPKNANLRDHQPMLALHYQGIAEEVSAQKLGTRQELSWEEARDIVKMVAGFIGRQAAETSQLLQMDIAIGKPLLGD